jgi:cytochrome c-type biogenesis protein CcmH
MKQIYAFIFWVAMAGSALAVQPDEILKDPVLESRARALSTELRCMVCQNQSIDESDAPLARDLRILVREQLINKKSDDEIKQFLVARYGEYVLLTPKFDQQTWVLWGLPFVILLGGLGYASRRRPKKIASEEALSLEEKEALQKIL